jgi:hydroxymethylbilane synthase
VTLRLGTRASDLALVQAEWVRAELRRRDAALAVEVVAIRTSGDLQSTGRLASVGGKGLFLKEIQEAMLSGTVDFAVHSMKDVPAEQPAGLVVAAVPARADARDVLIGSGGRGLRGLRDGARVGTASTRRRAQLLAQRPDLEVVVLRGNVPTRLRKWRAGEVDALVLAAAGLARLGLRDVEAVALDPDEMLPAVGQGALALECRCDDAAVRRRLGALADADASATVAAERGFLVAIGGDCDTPLAAHATVGEGVVALRAEVLAPDGDRRLAAADRGPVAEASAVGRRLAERLLAQGAGDLLRS